jgi:PPOX class probable F420-dependent enzyme
MIDLTSKFGRKVKRHLKNEKVIWLTTVGSDLTPQLRPVWFIWEDNSFLIFSQPHAHKIRHLAAHSKFSLANYVSSLPSLQRKRTSRITILDSELDPT